MSSMFVCRFDCMEELPYDDDMDGWYISTLPNENNIKIVFYASHRTGVTSLQAHLNATTYKDIFGQPRFRPGALSCFVKIKSRIPLQNEHFGIPIATVLPGSKSFTTASYHVSVDRTGPNCLTGLDLLMDKWRKVLLVLLSPDECDFDPAEHSQEVWTQQNFVIPMPAARPQALEDVTGCHPEPCV